MESSETVPNANQKKIDITSISVFDLNVGHAERESYIKDLIATTTLNMNGAGSLSGLRQFQGTPVVIAMPPIAPPTIITFGAPPFNQYPPYNMPQQPGYGNLETMNRYFLYFIFY